MNTLILIFIVALALLGAPLFSILRGVAGSLYSAD